MEITVRNIKEWATHDGGGFTCTAFADGIRFADVEQGGFGGPNYYTKKNEVLFARVIEWAKAQPEVPLSDGSPRTFRWDIDCYIGEAVNKFKESKRFNRMCKTSTVARFPDGKVYSWRVAYSPEIEAKLRKSGQVPAGSVFLNPEYQ